jgi:hypothetical protein
MRQETINIFTFEELSEEAQEKVLQEFSGINVNYEWWEFIYDDAKNVGVEIDGFDIGRGNRISGSIDDLETVCNKIIIEHGESTETAILALEYLDKFIVLNARLDRAVDVMDEIDRRYEDLNPEKADRVYDTADGIIEDCEDTIQDLAEEFEREILECYLTILRKEYEYLTSEEAIIETIQANEYEFTEDGSQY